MQHRLTAAWLAREAARLADERHGYPGGRPVDVLWPYGLDVEIDTTRVLLRELLVRVLPEFWEATVEDYHLAGIEAQRLQRESAALTQFDRLHI